MSNDWRYGEEKLKLRESCLLILLNKYGGTRIEEASYSTKDIYECVDTWVSQGHQIPHGIDSYFQTYFSNSSWMYHFNNYEQALRNFGIQVEFICAMEMAGKLTQEEAHQRVKAEYKQLKQVRKSEK